MAEYTLTCDVCDRSLAPGEGQISWTAEGERERDHKLAHVACTPADATDAVPLRVLLGPGGFLTFVTERLAHRIAQPDAVAAILWAVAPFITRPDTGVEMNTMRAATFGQVFGVKPGDIRRGHKVERERAGTSG